METLEQGSNSSRAQRNAHLYLQRPGVRRKNLQHSDRIRLTPFASQLKRRSTTPAQVAELVDALASGASVRM
ncbi:MAG: hypothetical protein AAGK26_07390, partial [Pseudomonadota bacterium]